MAIKFSEDAIYPRIFSWTDLNHRLLHHRQISSLERCEIWSYDCPNESFMRLFIFQNFLSLRAPFDTKFLPIKFYVSCFLQVGWERLTYQKSWTRFICGTWMDLLFFVSGFSSSFLSDHYSMNPCLCITFRPTQWILRLHLSKTL